MKDKKLTLKPLALAVGSTLAISLASLPVSAETSPFSAEKLSSGYSVVGGHADKGSHNSCGEAKCGADHDKVADGSCGEGKCGADHDKAADGSCGEGNCGHHDKDKASDGSCGEGMCGA